MKRFASTIALSFAAVLALPLTAIGQHVPNPNQCDDIYTDEGLQTLCTFHPTRQHDSLVVVLDSIQPVGAGSHSANFIYRNLPHASHDFSDGATTYAQVDCQQPNHWHRFFDDRRSEIIPVESEAARQMIGFVCHEAGIN